MKKIAIKWLALAAVGSVLSLNTFADDALDAKFNKSCNICHGQGLMGAPKIGDKAAWAPRLAKGKAVLLDHAKNGFNQMPPRGTCTDCTDEDLSKLIDRISK